MIGGGILGGCLAWDAALRGTQGGPGRAWGARRGHLGQQPSDHPGRPAYLVLGDLRRMRESIREPSALLRIPPAWSGPRPSPSPPAYAAIPTESAFGSTCPSTTPFPPSAIAPSFQVGICRPDGRCPRASWPPSVPASAPRPDAGEPYGLTHSCLAPNTLSGRLCARPQNVPVRGSTLRMQNVSPAGGRVLSVAIRDCQAGASRWSWPDISSWLRARGPGGGGGWEGVAPRAPRHALGLSLVVRRRLADAAISLRSERSATERIRR